MAPGPSGTQTGNVDIPALQQKAITLLDGMNVPWPEFVQTLETAGREGNFDGCLLTYQEGKARVGHIETPARNVHAGSSPPAGRY